MEPKCSLPHLQEPATCPCPAPDQSIPWRSIRLQNPLLILSSHLRIDIPSGMFLSGLPKKTLYAPLLSPINATRPEH